MSVEITHHVTIDGLELVSVADLGRGRVLRSSVTWETRELAVEFAPAARAAFEVRAGAVDPDVSSTTQIRRVRTPFGPVGVLTVTGDCPRLSVPQVRCVARGFWLAWLDRVLVVKLL